MEPWPKTPGPWEPVPVIKDYKSWDTGLQDPGYWTQDLAAQDPWSQDLELVTQKLLDLSACIHFYIFNFSFSNFWNCLMSKNLLACSIKHLFGFFCYFWETRTFIGLQNKTLKNKKSLTSKRDNAKYSFVYFSVIKITGFFFSS